jgi:hypothetical protein
MSVEKIFSNMSVAKKSICLVVDVLVDEWAEIRRNYCPFVPSPPATRSLLFGMKCTVLLMALDS